MTLEAIYYLTQIIAVVAILGSLIFVGVQIRQNTKAMKAAAAQAAHENFSSFYAAAGSSEVGDIVTRAFTDFDEMEAAEQWVFICHAMIFLSGLQDAYAKRREGSLSEDLWVGWRGNSLNFFSTPGGKSLWAQRRHMFGEPFQAFVEGELLNAMPPPNATLWVEPVDLNAESRGADTP